MPKLSCALVQGSRIMPFPFSGNLTLIFSLLKTLTLNGFLILRDLNVGANEGTFRSSAMDLELVYTFKHTHLQTQTGPHVWKVQLLLQIVH